MADGGGAPGAAQAAAWWRIERGVLVVLGRAEMPAGAQQRTGWRRGRRSSLSWAEVDCQVGTDFINWATKFEGLICFRPRKFYLFMSFS
jgi:hypothetical protein